MAKKSSTQPAAKAAPAPDTSASIDDIFASKPKPKSKPTPAPPPLANAIASSSKSTDPPKKKKKKTNAIPSFIPDEPLAAAATEKEPSKKMKQGKSAEGAIEAPKRVIEEVLDPSVQRAPAPAYVPTVSAASVAGVAKGGKKREKRKETGEDDEMFADSRGTGPRRKTEEGFLIYKEAELQIDPEAGGTPLCPFDCECCF